MKTVNALLASSLIALPVLAAEPWGKADPKAGKEHHDKACVTCHVRLYGGDGSKMYTRDGRLLSTQLDILQRVATCNAMTKAGWFPEEEAEVAAYLNQQYYHFKD
ncbi:MAG: cytochrome c [Dechloromonas sp.]|uniref:cytochrome c n=1 Tax=Ferribacterium limneticum TaxID=76259 RepID=UPI001CF8FE7D|nr:cytochrome c [Ferribacterium limneticum]MBT9520248.1 cytochrome c [Dechloromonas sp.]UCV21750.1 cytochrome c [Ferribacterium limneticum]